MIYTQFNLILCIVLPLCHSSDFKSPFGIEMCKVKCSTIVGCKRVYYLPATLECCVDVEMYTCNQSHGQTAEYTMQKIQPSVDHCVPTSQVITTRSYFTICITDPDRVHCTHGHLVYATLRVGGNRSTHWWTGTSLMYAARYGRTELFTYLVNKCNGSEANAKGENILHMACLGGNIDIVKYILSKDIVDKESRGVQSLTPLMYAVDGGHAMLVDYLLKSGCNSTSVNGYGNNILHVACLKGDVDMVKLILTSRAMHKESKGLAGRTPLMFAAQNGHVALFEFLLGQGCDYMAVDKKKNNVLHLACSNNRVEIVKRILRKNLNDKESRAKDQMTSLLYVARTGHIGLMDLLLDFGCNSSAVNVDNENILHIACGRNNVKMVQHILDLGILDIEAKGRNGMTPIMYTAESCIDIAEDDCIELFDLLLKSGCDPAAVDKDGDNILHYASSDGELEFVKHVMPLNVIDKNSQGECGYTALMHAAREDKLEMFEFLIQRGCDPTLVDEKGYNILHHACLYNNMRIIRRILSFDIVDKNGNNVITPLLIAAEKNHIELFSYLLKSGCDPSVVDQHNDSILHVACAQGNVEMVEYFLDNNISDIDGRGHNGKTPLMVAVQHENKQLFDLLVKKRCDITAVDENRCNVLHLAVKDERLSMWKHILTLKNVQRLKMMKNCLGLTPGRVAQYMDNEDEDGDYRT